MTEMPLIGIVVSLCKVESPRVGGGKDKTVQADCQQYSYGYRYLRRKEPDFLRKCPAHHFPRVEAEH